MDGVSEGWTAKKALEANQSACCFCFLGELLVTCLEHVAQIGGEHVASIMGLEYIYIYITLLNQ